MNMYKTKGNFIGRKKNIIKKSVGRIMTCCTLVAFPVVLFLFIEGK